MKRVLLFALCALLFSSVIVERRASIAHAFLNSQTQSGEAAKADASVVHELDLEGLKKLLQPGEGKDARPVLINFWATWCEPCKEEFPDLIRIDADYQKRGLKTVFISLDDPTDIKTTVPQFLREMRADKLSSFLLNIPDPEPAIKMVDAEWHGALPATFLFDAQGKLVFKHTGRIKPAELRAALDKIVKNP
jgi:thiol-disulfide isomerase/thioredoxin